MLHKSAAADDIHTLVNWVVADLAARNALVPVAADKHKLLYQTDTGTYHFLVNNVGPVWLVLSTGAPSTNNYIIPIAVSDETTILTTGAAKVTFRMPKAMTLSSIKGSLTVAQVGGVVLDFDIKEAGVSIFSTRPTFNNGSKTTVGATTPAVISDVNLAADAEMTIDIIATGDGTAKGLKVYLIGA